MLLAEVQPAGAQWQLRSWGAAVPLEAGTLLSCFSPDGRFFFANGSPAATDPKRPARGVVLSVRLDATPGRAGGPVHTVVSRVPTGVVPEGLAISPDGQLLVTTNLEQTFLPLGQPQRSRFPCLPWTRPLAC